MLLRDIINAEKEITDGGKWANDLLMPKSQFPLHNATKIVRKVHTWKLIRFTCLGEKFKLLIFYRLDKEDFYAWLALDANPVTILGKYEYHATHPGWHLHACCDSSDSEQGRTRGHFRRLPGPHSRHRKLEFGVQSPDDAEAIAASFFNIKMWHPPVNGTGDLFKPSK